ncbi:hypothetical protein [Xenorhabdus bovienii]|uniref:hypothetical protein n=1 Tax=Xenorhabdus bovienii TaxID=40576 RepID=UPI0023B29E1A|nr:hypothetical protein [Xenorhabdus bovienii]MDE9483684.1 hypothetical protein [Xenorhabdus bovienii]
MSNYRSVIVNGIVTLYCQQENGKEEIVISLPVTTILDRANSGEWDVKPQIGMTLVSAWLRTLPDNKPINDVRFFRWMVAQVWVTEQKRKNNGKSIFTLENSPIVFPLSLESERFALKTMIEGTLTDHYGQEQGIENASIFYQQMMMPSTKHILVLSDFGKKVLTTMYRGFIENGVTLIAPNKPDTLH